MMLLINSIIYVILFLVQVAGQYYERKFRREMRKFFEQQEQFSIQHAKDLAALSEELDRLRKDLKAYNPTYHFHEN